MVGADVGNVGGCCQVVVKLCCRGRGRRNGEFQIVRIKKK